MIRRLNLIITIFSTLLAMAQGESSYTLNLKAINGMANNQVAATFYILERDSVATDSVFTPESHYFINGAEVKRMYLASRVIKAVPGSEKLLKVTCGGFETEIMPLVFPTGKSRTIDMLDIKLWPVRSEIELDEVVVKHSRVKMVMKGDTVVFDAAKFQLAHGDMLSQMVKQMEGLSFENGVIYMNGRKVDDLLVNGESFFKGDLSVALNNLPAFTIRNIKFYEKAPDSEYLTGHAVGEDKDYVLDVTLKKEYVSGYLGNLEGGYGTKDRYIGRGFGLGFGQNFRLSAFANLNNLQNVQTASATSDGDWNSRGTGGGNYGLADRQLAGIDYIWNPNKELKLKGQVSFQHNTQQNDRIESATNFLESGDTYSRTNVYNHRREFRLSTYHTWQLTKPKFFMEIKPEMDFNHFNSNTLDLSALYNEIPSETSMGQAVDSIFSPNHSGIWSRDLRYSRYDRNRSKTNNIGLRLYYNSRIKPKADATDYFSVAAFVKYYDNKTPGIRNYDLSYPETPDYNDSYVRLSRLKVRSLEWEGCLAYDWRTAPNSHDVVFSIRPYASFNSTHDNNSSRYYPLGDSEWAGPWASIELSDAIQTNIDRQNSNWHSQQTENTKLRMQFGLAKSVQLLEITASAAMNRRHSSMDFNKPDFFQQISRNDWLPEAWFSLAHSKRGEKLTTNADFNARFEESAPELTYLVDNRNTLDPLNIYLPNPDLKRPSKINLDLYSSFYYNPLNWGVSMHADFTTYFNRTVQGRVYDAATGRTTWTPVSMNGSNECYAGIYTYFNIYRGLRGSIGYNLSGNRSVVLLTDQTFSGKNTVNYMYHSPTASLSWSQTNLNVWTSFAYGYSKSRGSRAGYGDYTLRTPTFSCNVEYKCPWKMKLMTEFRSTFSSGNDNEAMNSDSYFWTIRVSQPFANDKWSVTLTFSDILNSRKTIWTSVDANAAVTTWQQQLPRYVMATFSYRFHYNPRK